MKKGGGFKEKGFSLRRPPEGSERVMCSNASEERGIESSRALAERKKMIIVRVVEAEGDDFCRRPEVAAYRCFRVTKGIGRWPRILDIVAIVDDHGGGAVAGE